MPIEAISWRVLTRGPDPDLRLVAAPTGDGDALKGTRDVYFDDGYVETPIYDRYQMGPGTHDRRAGDRRGTRVHHRRRPGRDRPRGRGRQPDHRGDELTLDPVTVGIAAGRLASILDEQQATLVRTAF